MYTEGISASGDLLDLAVTCDVVEKSGSWFSYGSTRIGQGREASKQFLKDQPELFKEIRAAVLAKRAANPVTGVAKPGEEDEDGDEE